jgi:hypothetical protein
MTALHLHDFQVSRERRVLAFASSNSPSHFRVVRIYPSLQASNLDVAAADLLFGTLNFEVFVCGLSIDRDGPGFREEVVVGVLENLKLGEVAVLDNFGVFEVGARWRLKRCKGIIAVDCIANRITAARECLRNVFP